MAACRLRHHHVSPVTPPVPRAHYWKICQLSNSEDAKPQATPGPHTRRFYFPTTRIMWLLCSELLSSSAHSQGHAPRRTSRLTTPPNHQRGHVKSSSTLPQPRRDHCWTGGKLCNNDNASTCHHLPLLHSIRNEVHCFAHPKVCQTQRAGLSFVGDHHSQHSGRTPARSAS